MKKNYSYDDVLLVPQFSDIESRKEIDISANMGNHIYLSTPIISAPMDTVTNQHMANALNECGALGVIHRYNTIQEQLNSVKGVNVYRAAAIGTTGDWQERAMALVNDGNVNALCVDIAHGHHVLMKRALEWLRDNFDNTHIMAGNVATLKAFDDLSDWGRTPFELVSVVAQPVLLESSLVMGFLVYLVSWSVRNQTEMPYSLPMEVLKALVTL